MKKLGCKTLGAVMLIAVVVATTGCQEQSTTKKSKVIAAENIELKNELAQQDNEIQRQKDLLEQCQQQNETLKEQAKKNMQDQLNAVLSGVVKQNSDLKQKIKALEEQLKELKEHKAMLQAQVEQLEKKFKEKEIESPGLKPL